MIFNSAVIALGGLRLSKFLNNVDPQASRETEDASTLEDKVKKVAKTTFQHSISVAGYAEVDVERALIESYKDEGIPLPFTMLPFDDQDLAILAEVTVTRLSWDFEQSKQRKFEAELAPLSEIQVGRALYSSFPSALVTASTVGPKVPLGALGVGDEAVFTFHVLRPPGVLGTTPQLAAVIETDVAAAPWDAPVARITAAPMTDVGAQVFRLDGAADGAITDPVWALNLSVTGTAPSFYVVAAGLVQPKL